MYGLLLLYRLYHNSRRAPHQRTNSDTESDSSKDRVLSYPRKRLVKDPEFCKFVGIFFGLLLLDSLFWGLPIILIAGGYYEYLARLHDAAAHVEKRYYSSKAMIELHVSELEWSNPMTAGEIPRVTCSDNGAYCGSRNNTQHLYALVWNEQIRKETWIDVFIHETEDGSDNRDFNS